MAEYTLDEVAGHATPGDYWLVIHGKVYNVTGYLDDHPGGANVLQEVAGSDATGDFDFVGHSASAKKALRQFEVGSLAGYTVRAKKTVEKISLTQVNAVGSSSTLLSRTTKGAFLTTFGVGLVMGARALYNLQPLKFTQPTASSLSLGPLNYGWAAVLMGAATVGWVAFNRLHHYLFYYKTVFEYEPYY
ncbi:cytochrome b5 [Hypoxylon sp. NC1633]|nr:cytochrome b5 [Hypoxylon sp. NC1633]